ncbi:MAG: hypothetical protein AVDCRST_MAG91-2073 [uncultured Sphingomonadaceae bacterium]|uniref:DUF2141 domain-containing protein n=1 Tax=uncultured Sphingomonadaceae bacterium TaxID=169976 RepID=A0A6J4TCM3_9SPHN|nr:MAG: hypothetical protein AVDCRST_MAG91-2073 [uncultured Sphingomonadaceae bacterium]
MRMLLPIAAALALTACGGQAANETAATNAGATGTAATEPMDMSGGNATAGNDMTAAGGAVTVTVNGVRANGGPVLVALQNSGNFLQAAGAYTTTVQPTGTSVTATIQDVAPGRYAAAVVQDTDGDGTATIGAQGPSEPWGLSGTPQTTGAPTFEPAAFEVAATGGEATVTLQAK